MSDIEQELFDRILHCELHVDSQTLVVSYKHRRNNRWYQKKPDYHPVSGRARFRFGPKRLTVYRNRIVWMYFNRRAIPDGYVVDHIDLDCKNDAPNNLRVQCANGSHKQGNDIQSDKVLEMLCDYFDMCGFLGHPPKWAETA